MKSLSNFERLVLGCIDSYDSDQRLILQHFSRSTRSAFFFAPLRSKKFNKRLVNIFDGRGEKRNFISSAFFDEFYDFSAKN